MLQQRLYQNIKANLPKDPLPELSADQGVVFNIQRFTIHDGPGIRTEVFLKGCPLHCKWCSNPESMKLHPQVAVTSSRCVGVDNCGYCMAACPVEKEAMFRVEKGKVAAIDRDLCTDCLQCAEVCPANAIKMFGKQMTIAEVMKVILADQEFYDKSGGGVTVSGGEALVQWQFTAQLLRECKKKHLHTCLESALHCQEDILEKVYPYVDLVLTDIKHMDSAKHREYTGAGNETILNNIKKTVAMGKPLVIRIPVVPGHNDSEDNIRATAEFISNQLGNRVLQVQLLPYRPLGEEKYQALGLEYPMAGLERPERWEWETNIRHLAEVMKSYRVNAVAGTTTSIKPG